MHKVYHPEQCLLLVLDNPLRGMHKRVICRFTSLTDSIPPLVTHVSPAPKRTGGTWPSENIPNARLDYFVFTMKAVYSAELLSINLPKGKEIPVHLGLQCIP